DEGAGCAASTVSAVARRRIAFRTSDTTMIDSATAMQTSHCRRARLVVDRNFWNGPMTVARMSVSTDTPVATLKVLSEKVSRPNTVWRSSLVAIEKNKA